MASKDDKGIAYYLALEYPYIVVRDEDEFFVRFPDLPGCMTQVERAEEIDLMAEEIKHLWLETALEAGQRIPEPVSEEFSGKFLVRIPKTLHRDLVHQAQQEGMSLNSWVMHLLSSRSIQSRLEDLVVSVVASQHGMRHSSHRAGGSHHFLVDTTNPFSSHRSSRKRRSKPSMSMEDWPIGYAYTLNPTPNFAS